MTLESSMNRLVLRAAKAAAILAALAAMPAFAHVTLETKQAPVGSYYKAVFRVPHGCAGSPTLKVRVRVPEGVISIKPQPKPGWTLETVKGSYAQPYTVHGAQITSGVKEVSWSGKLLDDNYDEFVFQAYLAEPTLKPGQVLYFPVVQECEKGVERWIDTASPSDKPAPSLKLLPKP